MNQSIDWNDNEILLYLGYRGQELEDEFLRQLSECKKQIEHAMEYKEVYQEFSLSQMNVEGTSLTLLGDSISEHLKDCSKVILMAVTLGAGVEQLMMRTQVSDMSLALIMDACASAAVEAVCNKLQQKLEAAYGKQKLYLTDRFSPGYGDLPISLQGEFCRVLNTARRIGLSVTGTNIMVPRKSVTAIIGCADTPREHRKTGCETCNMFRSCKFRKEGRHCGK